MKKIISCVFVLSLLLISCTSNGQTGHKEKPLNIILMIGDGMGLPQIQAGMIASHGTLEFLKFPVTGLQKTQSADNYITDSAAGATAFSTGKKTNNKSVALDTSGNVLKTILEFAEEKGLSTGLISTSSITHATPASFIAHQKSRYMDEEIAADFLKTDIDLFIGGGLQYFNKRSDSTDLTLDLKNKGYTLITDPAELNAFNGSKLAALLANDELPKMSEGRGNLLPVATKKAIEILSQNRKGFFLMVEGSQIDWGGHANDQKYIINEILDFSNTVKVANEFAMEKGNTLIIVTADHETGGFTILNGNMKTGEVKSTFNTKGHTGTMVPVFATGPGSKAFTGVYENTAIFDKMKMLLVP